MGRERFSLKLHFSLLRGARLTCDVSPGLAKKKTTETGIYSIARRINLVSSCQFKLA